MMDNAVFKDQVVTDEGNNDGQVGCKTPVCQRVGMKEVSVAQH